MIMARSVLYLVKTGHDHGGCPKGLAYGTTLLRAGGEPWAQDDSAKDRLAAALAAEGAAAGGGAVGALDLAGALGAIRVRAGVGAALAI